MSLRALLVALVVASTAAFVVGTTLERNHRHTESAATLKAEGAAATPAKNQVATTAPPTTTVKARSKHPKTTPAAANPSEHAGESAAHRRAEGLPPEAPAKPTSHAGESAARRRAETRPSQTISTAAGHAEAKGTESAVAHASESAHRETHAELKPLGVDIEAVPFVILAALVSLGLAAAAWSRPRSLILLLIFAGTMFAFAALDVREVFHQSDESQTGLAVLASAVAVLHLAAGIVAGLMASEARPRHPGTAGPAATMGA